MLLASIGMSWFAVRLQRAKTQREAVEAIKAAGGFVDYMDENDDSQKRALEATPTWLRRILGDEFFRQVDEVWVHTDTALEQTRRLAGLEALGIGCSDEITDAGLAHLDGLRRLRRLSLALNENVTNAGFAHLRVLVQLERLDMDFSTITDAGLDHLKGLKRLRHLSLSKTRITDAGLERLRSLSELESLDLTGTRVTDAGVKKLQQALPNCGVER